MDDFPDLIQWSPQSSIPLDVFLAQNKLPHSSAPDGWVWVRNGKSMEVEGSRLGEVKAVEEASALLDHATTQILEKKLTTTQKAYGAQIKESLKSIALKHNYTYGKWCLFPSVDSAQETFNIIARSLTSGNLLPTRATACKISSTPADNGFIYIICLYFPNVYNEAHASEILDALVADRLWPSAVKSDLYTSIGLDSKHPSKITPSIFPASHFPRAKERQAEVKAYWEAKRSGRAPNPPSASASTSASKTSSASAEKGKQKQQEGDDSEWAMNDCGVEVKRNSTLPSQIRPYDFTPPKSKPSTFTSFQRSSVPSGASKVKQAVVGAVKAAPVVVARAKASTRPKKFVGFESDDEEEE